MSDIFKFVKEYVTAKDVAICYGFRPNRSNLICCPFHDDKHPSMKVDIRFYCHGCGEYGDAIDFVSKYFGIGLREAAQKILEDFGIKRMPDVSRKQLISAQKQQNTVSQYQDRKAELTQITRKLMDYKTTVKERIKAHAPKSQDEEWSDAFANEINALMRATYLIDGCLFGVGDEKREFYDFYKEEVDELVRDTARDEKQTRRRARAK